MTYNQQLLKVTLGCKVNATDEVAETGFHAAVIDPLFDAAGYLALGASVAGSISSAFVTLRSATVFNTPAWSVYSYCKIAAIDTAGHYVAEPVIVSATSPGISTTGNPLQITPVLSLGSGQSLGYANRGRMYLPHMYPTIQASGYSYSSSVQSSILAAATTFFGSVNTALGSVTGFTQCRVVIASKRGTGSTKRASVLRVGNLPDTQRRRRNRTAETYVQGSI